ncbi:hypothetical protein EJ04DRAFT_507822 [Polyplosphaeria fusca]|uniref:Uncharacterized protein n=1 Tax=Polyplosphaeria fusca TaxID=682080 RepID=A0A9P4RCY6_9PLEO|nr:hypothetical protein EJ04DRAFT_507822 [Polyplosphaeria fusca]
MHFPGFSKTSPPASTHPSGASSKAESTRSSKDIHHSVIKSTLKKPFEGWSKDLLAARDGLDDDYNFASGKRRGAEVGDESED